MFSLPEILSSKNFFFQPLSKIFINCRILTVESYFSGLVNTDLPRCFSPQITAISRQIRIFLPSSEFSIMKNWHFNCGLVHNGKKRTDSSERRSILFKQCPENEQHRFKWVLLRPGKHKQQAGGFPRLRVCNGTGTQQLFSAAFANTNGREKNLKVTDFSRCG